MRSDGVYNRDMRNLTTVILLSSSFLTACGSNTGNVANAPSSNTANAGSENSANSGSGKTVPTPSNKLTKDDIAKLKWIEGTWRGMDGDKPFFERYRFEDTTMVVETLSPENLAKIEHTARFELKDGEFGRAQGKRRSAATEITDDHVQFVPVTGGGNNFRFERQADGTWNAVLEWVGPDNEPKQRIYKMEPYKE